MLRKGKYWMLILFGICPFLLLAQEEPAKIKVVKESDLAKAVYDNVEYKLVALDKFGNVVEHAVKYFEIHYVGKKKKLVIFKSNSEYLTPEMLDDFKKLKEAKKIFFTKIIAEDEYGNKVKLPDVIEVQFPDCKIKKELQNH